MGERKLTEPFRESGDWYLPNNKENSLSGELIYEPGESLRLELVGRFRRDPNEAFNLESVPTILGELSNQYVTLYQCERTNLSVNIPGKGRSVFQPRFALFGAHDKSLEQPDVSCLIVRIPELEEWLLRCGLSGLAASMHTTETGSDEFGGAMFKYEPRNNTAIQINGTLLELVPGVKVSGIGPSTVGFASLQEQVQLRFVFAEEIPFTEALDRYLSPLVDFSNLVTGSSSRSTSISIKEGLDIGQGRTIPQTFPVVFNNGWLGEPSDLGTTSRIDQYLVDPHGLSQEQLIELVQSWFASYQQYERSMHLTFGIERAPTGTYAEVRFVTLCHAAEALHRDSELSQFNYTEAEYKQLRDEAITHVQDEDLKAFMKGQLRFARDVTLRQRMFALREAAVGSDSELFPDRVLGAIVKTRNTVTHGRSKDVRTKVDTFDMYYFSEYLSWLIRGVILRNLGWQHGEIVALLASDSRVGRLNERLAAGEISCLEAEASDSDGI